jgi:hypothetical protein
VTSALLPAGVPPAVAHPRAAPGDLRTAVRRAHSPGSSGVKCAAGRRRGDSRASYRTRQSPRLHELGGKTPWPWSACTALTGPAPRGSGRGQAGEPGHDRELEAQPRHARHLENPRARRSTAGRAHENGVAHRVRKRDVITAEKRDARARLDEPSSVERRCAKVPRRRTAVPECGHAACAQTRAGAVRQAVGRPVQTCRMDREARSPIPPAGPLAGDRHACVAPGGRERSRRSVRPRLTAVARQPVVQPALATACAERARRAAGAEPAQRLEEPWVPSVASPAPRDRARDVGCESGSRHPWIPAGRRDGRVLLFAG